MILASYRRKRLIAAANRYRDRGDWHQAAEFYRQALVVAPDRSGLWIQYGHMLKEHGQIGAAEQAYLRATELSPDDPDAWLQLGHARKRLNRPAEAISAFAAAAALDWALEAARHELLHLGGREALPENGPSGLERALELSRLPQATAAMDRALDDWAAFAPRAPAEYHLFRSRYPVPPPPEPDTDAILHLFVLAKDAMPAAVRATLLSIIDQADQRWRVTVLSDSLDDHPVASLMFQDARIAFAPTTGPAEACPAVWLAAGTVVDREAIGWLRFAIGATTAVAIYADHDWCEHDWRRGAIRYNPCLFPMYDPYFFAAAPEAPAAICFRHATDPGQPDLNAPQDDILRIMALGADRCGTVAHVPRVLFSRRSLPRAVTTPKSAPPLATTDRFEAPPEPGEARLSIIIPTRDQSDLLRACVTSLQVRAARPELLDILILDNRGSPATKIALDELRMLPGVRIRDLNEPFNWSRFNNRAVELTNTEIICFVNDDTECLTHAWDNRLRIDLSDRQVGAVGARLLYPDQTLQHGGVIFGFGQGSPIHEGVGADAAAGGPLGRWRIPRAVPAVTGAFLAIRRDDFQRIGGFDEQALPVGFSDIDLCLRVRQEVGIVLYDPRLTLVHHESKSRGINDTLAKVIWDHDELASFHEKWGSAMLFDPGMNPGWSRHGHPFGGLIEPSERIVLDWLRRSARPRPWAPLDLDGA